MLVCPPSAWRVHLAMWLCNLVQTCCRAVSGSPAPVSACQFAKVVQCACLPKHGPVLAAAVAVTSLTSALLCTCRPSMSKQREGLPAHAVCAPVVSVPADRCHATALNGSPCLTLSLSHPCRQHAVPLHPVQPLHCCPWALCLTSHAMCC